MSNISILLLSIVFVWLIQLCLSYLQIQRFNTRVIALRKQGKKTAVGMAGSTYRRRVYAVLVVDERGQITAAERFGGWTVFASLKPVPALVGMLIEDIGEKPQFDIKPKIWKAFCNSTHYILEHDHTHAPAGKGSLRRGRAATTLPTGWSVGTPRKEKK